MTNILNEKMQVIQVNAADEGRNPFERPRYFIDCPIDVFPNELGGSNVECRRIEIPRELANYLNNLHDKIRKLEKEIHNVESDIS